MQNTPDSKFLLDLIFPVKIDYLGLFQNLQLRGIYHYNPSLGLNHERPGTPVNQKAKRVLGRSPFDRTGGQDGLVHRRNLPI